MKTLIIFTLAALASACTDDAETIRTLNAHGFSNIATTGYKPVQLW